MFLKTGPHTIAYDHVEGGGPCVVFCTGFNSTRNGNKANFIKALCVEHKHEFVRFDYTGHGESSGDFADGLISQWVFDTLEIINRVPKNKDIILVGSSMGGWMSILAALKAQKRIKGLLLLACAADMTSYQTSQLKQLELLSDSQGKQYYNVEYDNDEDYRVYKTMLDDGEQFKVLNSTISLDIPVILIHGKNDKVIEWQRSLKVLELLSSDNVTLELIKKGDHRLSRHEDLDTIGEKLIKLLKLPLVIS